MSQISHELVKEPVDDKKCALLFVFTPDSEQSGAFTVGGFEVSDVESGEF